MNFSPLKRRVRHLHFIGIGGSGMSGIAEVLLREGYQISGSDLSLHSGTRRLAELGAIIFSDHQAAHIQGAQVVVVSAAIESDNLELLAAQAASLPIIPRAEMLAELMRFRYGIAIAGTHGKTTTTSLVTSIFAEAGLDPTFVIGGLLNSAGTHANLGQGRYLIAEADESDGSFLHLNPIMVVITNIDQDHLSYYNNDFNQLQETFLAFIHRLPFYGLAVLCLDDPVIEKLLPRVARPHITYGFHPNADFRAEEIVQRGMHTRFLMRSPKTEDLTVTLNMPGKHNVLNALASLAIAHENGIDLQVAATALSRFQGVGRRLQSHGICRLTQDRCIELFDDYGHHPREIAVTIEALKAAHPGHRLLMVFQPHRYTRTQLLFEEFVAILSRVDELILLPVYTAGESPILGAHSEDLLLQLRLSLGERVRLSQVSDLPNQLVACLQDQDLLLMQGAGSIGKIVQQLENLKGNFEQLGDLSCD